MESKYIAGVGIVVLLLLAVYWMNADNGKASTVCTDANGNKKTVTCKTAPCACPSGYNSTEWTAGSYCENVALSLPYTDPTSKKTLQLNTPFYGKLMGNTTCGGNAVTADCSSDNAVQLTTDVAAGKDINIAVRGYNTYFGKDPCPSVSKYTTFNYRYV